jgi:hypothetical protein
VLYIRQELDEKSVNYLKSSLTNGLWWAVFISITVIMCVSIIDWVIRLKYGLQKPEDLPGSLFNIIGIFCQQGEYWVE